MLKWIDNSVGECEGWDLIWTEDDEQAEAGLAICLAKLWNEDGWYCEIAGAYKDLPFDKNANHAKHSVMTQMVLLGTELSKQASEMSLEMARAGLLSRE